MTMTRNRSSTKGSGKRCKHTRQFPYELKHVPLRDQLKFHRAPTGLPVLHKSSSASSNSFSCALKASQLSSEMSGFIAFRISAVACLLVFLYSRQSSAVHVFYRPTAANLPDDPNDPYYNSKSFFFQPLNVCDCCTNMLTAISQIRSTALFDLKLNHEPFSDSNSIGSASVK